MSTYYIKRHDLAPSVSFEALDYGVPVNLTAYDAVRFLMRQRGDAFLKVDAPAAFEDKPGGALRYDWVEGDTDTAGVFFAEFEVTGPGGIKRTVPARGQIRIEVSGDLDDA